jgi:hypothetical protein
VQGVIQASKWVRQEFTVVSGSALAVFGSNLQNQERADKEKEGALPTG